MTKGRRHKRIQVRPRLKALHCAHLKSQVFQGSRSQIFVQFIVTTRRTVRVFSETCRHVWSRHLVDQSSHHERNRNRLPQKKYRWLALPTKRSCVPPPQEAWSSPDPAKKNLHTGQKPPPRRTCLLFESVGQENPLAYDPTTVKPAQTKLLANSTSTKESLLRQCRT